jgi:hypothetical protein
MLSKIADAMLEVSIMEMATERKNIVQRARNLQTQIAHHVIKLHVWPQNQSANHWASEVDAWVDDIQDMVFDRNKRLTVETYIDLLWKEPFEHTDIIEKTIKRSIARGLPKVQTDHVQLNEDIKKVYYKICSLVSRGDYITIKEMIV